MDLRQITDQVTTDVELIDGRPRLVSKVAGEGAMAGWTIAEAGAGTIDAEASHIYLVDTTSGAATVNLPVATSGQAVRVKQVKVATNTITINPDGADTIDGSLTLVLSSDYEWAELIYSSGNWSQIS